MKSKLTIAILITSLFFTSCSNKKQAQNSTIPEVTVVAAGQKTIPLYTEYVGETSGQSDIEIKPRVEGWVQDIHFTEGGEVKKGQLLYTIQDDELRDRLITAEAQLAQANIQSVKAKSDLDRVRPLVEMNALSKRDLDAAQAAYDVQVQAVIAAKASLHNVHTLLSYTKITSPINGIIGISKVQVGDFVSKNALQSAINTVSYTGAIRVRFAITENDYLTFKQKVTDEKIKNIDMQLLLGNGTIFPETAKFDFANRAIDPSTGSLIVQGTVPNKSNLLRPGQYVKVRIKSGEITNAVLVPQQAINQMQNIYTAMIVDDSSKINMRPVTVGARVGSNWVIKEGLKAGEKVALIGNSFIKTGMPVKANMQPYSYDSTTIIH